MEEEIMKTVENTEVETPETEIAETTESGSNAGLVALVAAGLTAAAIAAFNFGKKKYKEHKARKEIESGKELDVKID